MGNCDSGIIPGEYNDIVIAWYGNRTQESRENDSGVL
jgi:hypothetical protein